MDEVSIEDSMSLLRVSRPTPLTSLTLSSILRQTEKPTSFFVIMSIDGVGLDILQEHLVHIANDFSRFPELQKNQEVTKSYETLKRLVKLITKINQVIQGSMGHPYSTETEEELAQVITWFSETLEEVSNMNRLCTAELVDAVVVCSIIIYINANALPNVVPFLSFEGGADLLSIGRSVNELTCSLPEIYSEPLDWTLKPVYLPREEDFWKIWQYADEESKDIIGYELLRVSKFYTAFVHDNKFDHLASWALTCPKYMSLCRKKNPYCLLLLCYYLAIIHYAIPKYWRLKRISLDYADLSDMVPDAYKPHLDWPMEICTQTRDYDKDFSRFSAGTIRRKYLRANEEMDNVVNRPDEKIILRDLRDDYFVN